MRGGILVCWFASFLVASITLLNAQEAGKTSEYPRVAIPGTELLEIKSSFVDQTYQIQVFLPLEYSDTAEMYPTVYLLDADISFGMASDMARLLQYRKEIPGVIIVGIAYGEGLSDWYYKRGRDYTPPIERKMVWGNWPQAGGVKNFMKFLQNELIPMIEEKYRSNPKRRILAGLSLGAFFASYMLFTDTEMFHGYIMSGAPYIWDDGTLARLEEEYYKTSKRLPAIVFSAIGELEPPDDIVEPWRQFNEHFQSRNYEGLKFKAMEFAGETHVSVWPAAFTRGLKYVLSEN